MTVGVRLEPLEHRVDGGIAVGVPVAPPSGTVVAPSDGRAPVPHPASPNPIAPSANAAAAKQDVRPVTGRGYRTARRRRHRPAWLASSARRRSLTGRHPNERSQRSGAVRLRCGAESNRSGITRHRCGSSSAEPRGDRRWCARLASNLGPRDPPRRRHGAAPVGNRRSGLPLGHHPPSRGRPRLRLAAARHLRGDGGRLGPGSACRRHPPGHARWPRPASRWPPSARWRSRSAQGGGRHRPTRRARPPHGAGRGDDRHRRGSTGGGHRLARQRAGEPPPAPRVPAGPRPRGADHRRRRAAWPPASPPEATRGSPWRGPSSAPPSSARSPTPCCSATGTSCSRACPARS